MWRYIFALACLAIEGIALPPGGAVAAGAVQIAQSGTPAVELEFWQSIKDSKTPAEFEAYLKAFPEGQFAPLARIRLDRLKQAGGAPKSELAAPASPSSSEPDEKQSASQSPPVHDCDRLAANTFDPDKVTEGIAWKDFVPDSAIKACRSALEKYPDEPRFQYQLGRALTKAESYTEALALHRKAAEKGYAAAMNTLGSGYRKGQGVGQDNTEAVKWYRRAAEKGYPAAMHNLGYMYREGLGVAKDKTEAVRLVRKAAEKGYIFAMTHLGVMYDKGRGVGQDYTEAVRWYRKAAEKGSARAMTNLGVMYNKGHGVGKDDAEAVKWYRKAAENGNVHAMTNLGTRYADGRVVARDETEAVRWFRKAADKGFARGMYSLGVMYENGQGVPKDKAEAVRWYRRAAEKGFADAIKRLKVLGVDFQPSSTGTSAPEKSATSEALEKMPDIEGLGKLR